MGGYGFRSLSHSSLKVGSVVDLSVNCVNLLVILALVLFGMGSEPNVVVFIMVLLVILVLVYWCAHCPVAHIHIYLRSVYFAVYSTPYIPYKTGNHL